MASQLGLTGSVARLVRARWRIAWNTLRRASGWRRLVGVVVLAALGFLAFMSLLASYVMTRVIAGASEDVAAADVIPVSAFSSGLVLSFMVSFTVALAALYLSKDLDLLLGSPLSRRAVFFSKLIAGLLPAHLVILTLSALPLVGHGLALDAGAGYYLGALMALAALPILPVAVGSTCVVLIVRYVSAQRVGEIVGLIVVAMTLSLALVLGSARQLQQAVSLRDLLGILGRFRHPYSPAEWLTRFLVGVSRGPASDGWLWFGLLLILAAASLVPLWWVADSVYDEGWLRMQAAARRSLLRRGFLPWQRTDRAADLSRPSGFLRLLPQPMVAVIRKDWRVIPRDLTNIAGVLSPLAIGIFFILQQLLYPIRFGESGMPQSFVVPLLTMLSAAVATGVSGMIMSRFALTAFSFEGKSYWVIKGSPISARHLVLGKFIACWVPMGLLGGSLVLLLDLARSYNDARLSGTGLPAAIMAGLGQGYIFYAWFVVAALGAGVIAISLALGAARPNLRWDTPHEMLTPDLGCLSLVLYAGYAAVAGSALMLPLAVSQFRLLGSPALLWAGGLTVGLGLTVIAVLGSLWVAMGEMAAVGE